MTYAKTNTKTTFSHRRDCRRGWAQEWKREARALAQKILEALDYVGVMGIEFFIARDDQGLERLIVNELAPRVHNSGHWTIEGAATSQFEQHLRAVAGWPLGSTQAVWRNRDDQSGRRRGRPMAGDFERPVGEPASLRQSRNQAWAQNGPCDLGALGWRRRQSNAGLAVWTAPAAFVKTNPRNQRAVLPGAARLLCLTHSRARRGSAAVKTGPIPCKFSSATTTSIKRSKP